MKKRIITIALLAISLSQSVFAAMPQVTPPEGVEAGNYVGFMRWGIGAIVMLIALAVAGFGLVSVGGSSLKKFREYGDGRADIGDVISLVAVGIVVLFVAVALAYAATQVIPVNIL